MKKYAYTVKSKRVETFEPVFAMNVGRRVIGLIDLVMTNTKQSE